MVVLTFSELFEPIYFCPLCKNSSNESLILYSVKHFDWNINVQQCKNCGLTYKSHFPSQALFKKIYSQSYTHYQTDNFLQEIKELNHRVRRVGVPKGKLLDYGCGNGGFVMAALKRGWDAYGCDPFLPDILAEDELYKRCFKSDFSKNSFADNERYDCITMWATAEHLINTESTFLNLFSKLSLNGTFVFNSPFGNSKIAHRNGRNWRMSNIVEHLQFHTFKSIKYLASI